LFKARPGLRPSGAYNELWSMYIQMSSPGTVSKILWHFTGGPVWDECNQRQSDECKSDKIAFMNMKNILRTRELRLGKYREVVKHIIPEREVLDLNIMQNVIEKNVPLVFESFPVCCVAEIPLKDIAYISKRYGKFAIGFYRDSLLTQFRPVTYILENEKILLHYIKAYEEAVRLNKDIALLPNQINENIEVIQSKENLLRIGLLAYIFDDQSKQLQYIAEVIKRSISYIKTITYEELDTIYCEREWRSIQKYYIRRKDIAFIVIPKYFVQKEKLNIESFTRSLHIQRSVPIIPWEDIVE
jgi:hypothetical protein